MDDELPEDIARKIETLSERGNIKSDAGLHDEAIADWERALALLPQPKAKWDAALWLHASIGDALKTKGDVAAALERFRDAARCSDGGANAFVQFNLGTCELDLGRPAAAVDPLLRAYMMDGEEIFEGEHPRYLDLLREKKLVD